MDIHTLRVEMYKSVPTPFTDSYEHSKSFQSQTLEWMEHVATIQFKRALADFQFGDIEAHHRALKIAYLNK